MGRPVACVTVGIASIAMGCGGAGAGGDEMGVDGGEPPAVVESLAPPCADLAAAEAPRELFTHPVVDPDEVSDALVFGDMEPASPQEVLNFELGFTIPESDVPLTAPANLYLESIERSYHPDSEITDWGITYHVCSYQDGNVTRAAVSGNFAHLTTINAELSELFEEELQALLDGQPSAVSCFGDDNEECGLNVNMLRELVDDPDYALVLEAGAALGTGGPVAGKNGPAGIDTNLIDRRINDYAGNYYINPDRLGAEGGPGMSWRYGACTYEYFVEPYRSQYLGKISKLGEPRVSEDAPCGDIEVDRDAAGTIAGLWALSSMEDDVMDPDIGGPDLDTYLSDLLVLTDHMMSPDSEMMLSTPIDELSNLSGEASVFAFDKAEEGDASWEKLVNVPFRSTEPGSVYCYAGTRYGGVVDAYYLAEVSEDGSTLTLERVAEDCTEVPAASRTFDGDSEQHFVFVR